MLLTIHYLPDAARVADDGGLTGAISAIISRGLFHESDAKSQYKAHFTKYPHYRWLKPTAPHPHRSSDQNSSRVTKSQSSANSPNRAATVST